ncbi:MAG: integrase [Xanthobacteraceae bacterium]
METKAKAPGLSWPRGKPIWRASRAAIKAKFTPKWVNLSSFAHDETALVARCQRLTVEMHDWLSGRRGGGPVFDGTVGSLIRFYQVEPHSPYHKLEASSRHPYDSYARMIIETVGNRRIGVLDGRDLTRWHSEWSAPLALGQKPRLAAARMAMIVLKTALSFGIACRLPACADLKLILQQQRFPTPRPRLEAPTADEIVAARRAAHAMGHPLGALAYALQFEGTMRQWDVIGKWVPLSDKRPSSVIDGNEKWIGPMWSQIDKNMILRYTPAKTQFTSGAQVTLDLRECPMVLVELGKVPEGARHGPLIVSPKTGLPYAYERFRDLWRAVADQAGIRLEVWNRDLRAAAVTEARQAAAPTDDVAKVAGHANKRTTAKVYDRDHLEAQRRVMKARVAHRGKDGE